MRELHLKLWSGLCLLLGLALLAARLLAGDAAELSEPNRQALALVRWGGVGLFVLGAAAWPLRRALARLTDDDDIGAPRVSRRPYLTLFVISFVVLFVEVMLIRYCGSQIRIFSFYKNVPLVSAFLGLGLGACLGKGRPHHLLVFLLWLVPLAVALSQGVLAVDRGLGAVAARASSEHILGDVSPRPESVAELLMSQLLIGLFCVMVLVAITSLFALLGRLLGEAFEQVERLPGYTVNILGSLAGILGFVLASYLEAPPWVWFVIGLAPLFWWLRPRPQLGLAAALIALSALAVTPSIGETVWSPYQKLVGFPLRAAATDGSTGARDAYLIQISDVFYQIAIDLSPEAVAHAGGNRFPHYDAAFAELSKRDRVLIVGAGTGNDVAAALRAGVKSVHAVDIDPAIVEVGRRHHPERPYDDPRVEILVDDARSVFERQPAGSYDAVIFGLLDSHTQLGMSSVRLDNYVFTVESLAAAARLLDDGGSLVLSAATFRPWFFERFVAMLGSTCGAPVETARFGPWTTYRCEVRRGDAGTPPLAADLRRDLPTDDWPFLYLPRRGIPLAYVIVVLMLAAASWVVLRVGGLELGRFTPYHGHLFFLGAAFLLMEVYAINRLALLFGTTWLVSAVTIGLILTLIVAANLTVALTGGRTPYAVAYLALFVSLVASYGLEPASVLGRGLGYTLGYGLLLLSPVFFAGLVFARSFRMASVAGPAIGANILGAVLGGWVEYSTMLTGIRAMALLALVLYLASLLGLLAWRRQGAAAS